jgi:hypothetical protein
MIEQRNTLARPGTYKSAIVHWVDYRDCLNWAVTSWVRSTSALCWRDEIFEPVAKDRTIINGYDLRIRNRHAAMLDTETGELVERQLGRENGEARNL